MLKATLNGDDVRRAIAQLKEIDPNLEKQLKRDIRSGLSGPASAIQGAWPAMALRGMDTLGRTAYDGRVKASVSVTPGVARRDKASTLIAIKVKMPDSPVGVWIGEMAGLRGKYKTGKSREYTKGFSTQSHRLNGQGEAMVNALNQKYGRADHGGRWGWRKFVNMKHNIQNIGMDILESYVSQLNRES